MREHPDGAELLAAARELLRRELLPLLPKDRQYDALMIANAMGIAERQLQMGEAVLVAEAEELARLLDNHAEPKTLLKELAQQVRAGAFDDSPEVQDFLWRLTLRRVRESAPRALAGLGLE